MNAAVRLWARAILRRHWRSTIFLAVFAGLAGGAVMTAWSYSRRAHTVVDRRLEAYGAPDGGFQSCPPGVDPSIDITPCFTLDGNRAAFEGLRQSPHVSAARLYVGFAIALPGADLAEPLRVFGTATIAQEGEIAEYQIARGRTIDMASPTDLVLGESNVRALDATIDDAVDVEVCGIEFLDSETECRAAAPLHVVGVARLESDILPPNATPAGVAAETDGFGFITTYDWWEQNAVESSAFFTTSFRLTPGSTLADVRADMPALLPGYTTLVTPNEDTASFDGLRSATRLQARALLAVALVVLVAAVAFVGQAFARQIPRELAQHRTFVAIGADRRVTTAVAAWRAVPVAVGAAVVAILTTALASSSGPTGLASRAEVDRGFRADPFVLAIGAVVVALFVVMATVLLARRLDDDPVRAARRRPLGGWSSGLTPAAQAGHLLGRGRRASRSLAGAALGLAAAVASVSAAVTLVASLDRIDADPTLYGATWDYGVGDFSSGEDEADAAAEVQSDPMFVDAALVTYAGPIELDSAEPFSAVSFETVKGTLGPVIVEGREPVSDDEVAVGRATLDDLGLELGDVLPSLPVLVSTDEGGEEVAEGAANETVGPFRIVGVAVISANEALVGPGKGIVMTDAARTVLDPATGGEMVVRVDPALDPDEVLTALVAEYGAWLTIPNPQSDIRNLRVISGIPWVIAALITALALTALTNALFLNIRRSRTAIAVLRTIGLTSRQVLGAVGWQASMVAVLALLGIPFGVVLARWGWDSIAADIGFVAGPVVPLAGVVAIAAVTIIVANLIALWPGATAGRARLGTALRTE